MPKLVEIEVFNIARTTVDVHAVGHWLDRLGATEFASDSESHGVTDPAFVVALAAKRCYMAFEVGLNPNITKVRADMVEYLDNILRQRHGSVLEHAVYTYAIEGVSRVFTGEMNRHKAGTAVSEGSMRFIRFEEIPYWLPTCLRPVEGDDADLLARKESGRALFDRAFRQMELNNSEWNAIWDIDAGNKNFDFKKRVTSAGRRLIGMGVATGGVWSLNLRALRHVLAMRTEPAAEEEIFYVCCKIGRHITETEPAIFGDFKRMSWGGYQSENWKV